MFKKYYYLTKPGMVRGNAIVAAAGFLLAARGYIDYLLLCAMLAGIALIIASSCVFNNFLDKDIDGVMDRTKDRALVKGEISGKNALIFGAILGIIGALILGIFTNLLALAAALLGGLVYVLWYTPSKRWTVHSTLIGAISGAMPPVVGYLSVADRIDAAAVILFLVLFLWQMPHFYAIAMYRHKDYSSASLPVLPAQKGTQQAKIQMLLYVVAFTVAAVSLTAFGFAGYSYAVLMAVLGLVWFGMGMKGFKSDIDSALWARRMFFFSLAVLMLFSVGISVAVFLP